MKKSKKSYYKKLTPWYTKLDTAFSLLIRSKARCERCGSTINKLECSHVVSRVNKTLRWDILNALCLCSRCHKWWWHEEPTESGEWFKSKYPERSDYLRKAKRVIANRTEDDFKEIFEAIKNKDFHKLIVPQEILDKLE